MRVNVEDVTVYFPHRRMYPEQVEYMKHLKTVLDSKGHGVLQMPNGKGKSSALISFITSYRLSTPERLPLKLIYCTRRLNVEDTEKILTELKAVYNLQRSFLGDHANILAIGFASRHDKLCLDFGITDIPLSDEIDDSNCLAISASWIRELAVEDANLETCSYFDKYDADKPVLPSGVYTIQDLKNFGEENGYCPYFLAMDAMPRANVIVVCGYNYLVNPKFAGMISERLDSQSVVVFDDADDLPEICTRSLTFPLWKASLAHASRHVTLIRTQILKLSADDRDRFRAEYDRLLNGLAARNVQDLDPTDVWRAHPAVPSDIPVLPLPPAVPEDIRSPDRFLSALDHLIEFLEQFIRLEDVQDQRSLRTLIPSFPHHQLEFESLRFFYQSFHALISSLKFRKPNKYSFGVRQLCDFATMLGIYVDDPRFVFRRGPRQINDDIPNSYSPYALQLCCDDGSLAMKAVFERFQSVVITVGIGTCIDQYPNILNFQPVVSRPITGQEDDD